jgi:hypothetical protein
MLVTEGVRRLLELLRSDDLNPVGELYPENDFQQLVLGQPSRRYKPLVLIRR